MKKISILLAVISLLLITGCESSNKVYKESSNDIETNSTQIHQTCTREGAMDGGEVDFQYDIYYTDDILNYVKSQEKVTSEDQSILDQFETAYKDNIQAPHEGIKYCEIEVNRDSNSVAIITSIDYDKVNIDKLIAVEGDEDNIFEDGQAKVSKWKELGKKVGMKCSTVTEES